MAHLGTTVNQITAKKNNLTKMWCSNNVRHEPNNLLVLWVLLLYPNMHRFVGMDLGIRAI